MKKILLLLFFIPLFSVRGEYILPYPGPMPGNKMYKISKFIDTIQYYWSWGNIAKANYFVDISDKYLVEAKTLFEYKQYLLGVESLKQSDEAWNQIYPYLEKAQQEYLLQKHSEQAIIHTQSIDRLIDQLPETFTWTPEKDTATDLQLRTLLQTSLEIRQ